MAAEGPRQVENWILGETLGKGAYGLVKVGYHINNQKPYALKFMTKDRSWNQEDHKRVMIEINSLRTIRHQNVMRLKAFNLACMYPRADGTEEESVLLVMELCNGGELFDILFYTSKFQEIVARSYFKQLMDGLAAIHAAGVTHRDLKPQNLLLDHNFNLKITDFGLSSIFEGDDPEENIMATSCVGTRGYQAPEIVLNRRYTNRCDVFSCGVILFIFLTGYPPFEQAHATDTWYKPIAAKKPNKFWRKHKRCGIESDKAKDMIQRCITYQPQERATVSEVQGHPWLQEEILSQEELVNVMRVKHKEAVEKRRNDAAKQERLASEVTRDINMLEVDMTLEPPTTNEFLQPFSTFEILDNVHPYEVLNVVHCLLEHNGSGVVEFHPEKFEVTGNFRFETQDEMTINARAVKVDGKNYITIKRDCELFVQGNDFWNEIFSEILEYIGDPYVAPMINYDEDDDDELQASMNQNFNFDEEALPHVEDEPDTPAQ